MLPWQSREFDDHEQVCIFTEPGTRLRAIIAIHSTALGPAVGGTRFRAYAHDADALDDALCLSRAMSYKCALADLRLGGGKAVILGDPTDLKDRSLLHAFGRFLNRVGAYFSTGEDVGFSVADCEILREVTPFVAGTTTTGAGDPSVHTARGVFHGLRAVLEARLDRADFRGVHFAVQGLGSVGWRLCELLHAAGAQLTVADVRTDIIEQARERFQARAVAPALIHSTEVDIFVPCALGGILNRETVGAIRALAIAGAANNQLRSPEIGEELRQRGILFAPDYVINAGGVIGVLEEIATIPGRTLHVHQSVEVRLERIYNRLRDIFTRANADHSTPELTAARIAREIISR